MPDCMESYADLHMHSRVSDGGDSISRLVRNILRDPKLKAVALTDHDIYSSELYEMRDLLEESGYDGLFFPGAEFTTRLDGLEIHINAFAPNIYTPGFDAFMEVLKGNRKSKKGIWTHYLQEVLQDLKLIMTDGELGLSYNGKELDMSHVKSKGFDLDISKLEGLGLDTSLIGKTIAIDYERMKDLKRQNGLRRPTEIADVTNVIRDTIFPGDAEEKAYGLVYALFFTRGTEPDDLIPHSPEMIPNNTAYASPFETIKVINQAQGIPILNHLGAYWTKGRAGELIEMLSAAGAKAVETIYPAHTPKTVAKFTKLSKKYGMLRSGGTDYHGNRNEELLPDGSRFALPGEIILDGTDHITRVPIEFAYNIYNKMLELYGDKHSFFDVFNKHMKDGPISL